MSKTTKPLTILSLFDGMSCGQIALRDMGVPINRYYASEIDKHAIKQTQLNFPDTIQLGDVEKWREWDIDWPSIDLLLAGSPCQGFSMAGKTLGHDDPRSRLYWVFLDILRHIQTYNPNVKFLLENVRMRPNDERQINESLGLMPVVINSSLVSAQNRVRLYWSNIRTRQEGLFGDVHTDIPQPVDRGVSVMDIIEDDADDRYYLSDGALKWIHTHAKKRGRVNLAIVNDMCKSLCLTVSNTTKYHLDANFVRVQIPAYKIHGILQIGRGYVKSKVHTSKSPTLTSSCWQENNMVCAMRGRGEANVQTIEIRPDSTSNTLTSVAKDNLVIPGTWRTHKVDGGFREMAGDKSPCIPARARNDGSGQPCVKIDRMLRRLTPTECARLQTIPEWYKWECSDTQAYKMLGNGWTVEVIKHILSFVDN